MCIYTAHAHTYSWVRPWLVSKLQRAFRRAHALGDTGLKNLLQLSTQPRAFPGTQSGKAVRRRLVFLPSRVSFIGSSTYKIKALPVCSMKPTTEKRQRFSSVCVCLAPLQLSAATHQFTPCQIQPCVCKQRGDKADVEEYTNKLHSVWPVAR